MSTGEKARVLETSRPRTSTSLPCSAPPSATRAQNCEFFDSLADLVLIQAIAFNQRRATVPSALKPGAEPGTCARRTRAG